MRRTFAAARLGALAAIAFAGLGGIDLMFGAMPTAIAAPTKPASAASKAFKSGSSAYKKGSYKTATEQLSLALRAGGLSSREMAHAMYMRGLAYKKMNKPGLAISDLTSAVWLKNGLNEAEKRNALAARTEAYRMAGLADGEQAAAIVVADPKAASTPPPTTAPTPQPTQIQPQPAASPATAAAAPAAAQPVANNSPTPSSQFASTQSASTARHNATQPVEDHALTSAVAGQFASRDENSAQAAPTQQPAPAQQTTSDSSESSLPWLTGTTPSEPAQAQPTTTPPPATTVAKNTPTSPPVVEQAPSAATPTLNAAPVDNGISALPGNTTTTDSAGTADLSTVPSQVTGFFSNLFSGSSGTTSNSQPEQQQIAAAEPAASGPQVSSFTTSAIPEPAQPTAPPTTAAPASPPPPEAATATAASFTPGKYKLHIAALRSKSEAEQLAANLAAKHSGDFENRRPVIDKAAIGSMGTFYRVRLGGYKSAAIPQKICEKLRGGGFDCLVVTN